MLLFSLPKEISDCENASRNGPGRLLEVPDKVVEAMGKPKTGHGDKGDPGARAENIEEQKFAPVHPQRPGHWSCNRAQPENVSGPEDGCSAMAVNLVFGHRYVLAQFCFFPQPAQNARAELSTDPKPAVISKYRSTDAYRNNDCE